MKYNPDELNELPLSDYEKGYLTAVYDELASVEAKGYIDEYPEENFWFIQVVGDRQFDMCIYFDVQKIERRSGPDPHYTEDLVCVVYECHPDIDDMGNPTGTYSTDTSLEYFLKEIDDGNNN